MTDREILTRVTDRENYFVGVFVEDNVSDWDVARELGMYLIRNLPEEVVSHLMVARASRHLGDFEVAKDELERSRRMLMMGNCPEAEMMLRVINEEDRFFQP